MTWTNKIVVGSIAAVFLLYITCDVAARPGHDAGLIEDANEVEDRQKRQATPPPTLPKSPPSPVQTSTLKPAPSVPQPSSPKPPSSAPQASPPKPPSSAPDTSPPKPPTSSPQTSPPKPPTSSPQTSPPKPPTSSPQTSPPKPTSSSPQTSPPKPTQRSVPQAQVTTPRTRTATNKPPSAATPAAVECNRNGSKNGKRKCKGKGKKKGNGQNKNQNKKNGQKNGNNGQARQKRAVDDLSFFESLNEQQMINDIFDLGNSN